MYNTKYYYPNNVYMGRQINYNRADNRLIGPGNFLFPFALGFISSPLVYGATRPRDRKSVV